MKNLRLLCVVAICALSLNVSYAQAAKANKKAEKAAAIKKAITSNSYIFKADYVIPISMSAGPLNSANYDVTVNEGKLVVYLPYFGRAYTPPRDPSKGGIQLTTTDYDYTTVENKKGGWEITIKPKKTTIQTVEDVQVMKLSVSKDGYASLYVTSINRQPITFNGYIEEYKS